MMKVLVSDQISELGINKLREKGVVDLKTDLTPQELIVVLPEY